MYDQLGLLRIQQPDQDGSHGPASVNTRTHHIYPTESWWEPAPFDREYDCQGACRDIGLEREACLSWLVSKSYENRSSTPVQEKRYPVHYPNFIFFPPIIFIHPNAQSLSYHDQILSEFQNEMNRSASEIYTRTPALQATDRRRIVGKFDLLAGVIGYQPIMH